MVSPDGARLRAATIVFDLDGTLVDTAPDLVAALNATIEPLGLDGFSVDVMRPMVGQGARALIVRAAQARKVGLGEAELDALTGTFVEHYRQAIAVHSRPFPGCLTALDALADAGALLSVCTNKRTDLSVALLEALGLADRFRAIIGSDAVAARKPHPDHLRAAITQAGGDIARSVMIGDSAADVGAAKAAGVGVVLVGFGYLDEPAEAYGADHIIHNYDQLLPACAALLARRGV
jgi:phosphoglycolate phosphatase